MQRIAFLGGSFDPPHIAHLILGEYALEALDLEFLLFLPAADPPHKPQGTRASAVHRLEMLQLAIADNPRFRLSRVDVDRPGPHYTLDTVQILQAQYPDTELFMVMGGDSLRDLPRWYHPQELIQRCKLAVMQRPCVDADTAMHEAILPGLSERVVMIDAPLIGVSSTEIAQRLHEGKSVRYLVPPSVLTYIENTGIYKYAPNNAH